MSSSRQNECHQQFLRIGGTFIDYVDPNSDQFSLILKSVKRNDKYWAAILNIYSGEYRGDGSNGITLHVLKNWSSESSTEMPEFLDWTVTHMNEQNGTITIHSDTCTMDVRIVIDWPNPNTSETQEP